MKKTTLIISFTVFLLFSVKAQKKTDNVLTNIQNKLTWTTTKDSLLYYIKAMQELQNGKTNSHINYWEAYAKYLLYYDYDLKNEQEKEQAEKTIEEAIKLLEDIDKKNSEHYALLSLLGGLQLNFVNALMLPFRASKVGKNAEKAIQMAPQNIRAYLALGIYDYHTPKMYGGMKVVEETLKKAITLNDKYDPNPYSPDWGKQETYLYLVKFYNYEKRKNEALKYLEEGLKLYPNFETLKKMRAKIEKLN